MYWRLITELHTRIKLMSGSVNLTNIIMWFLFEIEKCLIGLGLGLSFLIPMITTDDDRKL